MTIDPKAKKMTYTYKGGSITATRGLLEAIFGPALVSNELEESKQVSRSAHSRRVVIGGPATGVRAASYTKKRYGTTAGQGASGGEEIKFLVGADYWTARLYGSHQAFVEFLKTATWQSGNAAIWYSEKGTKYGPFNSAVTP